jgi:hypothetical protein
MLHKYATMVGLALVLLCLASPVVFAQDSESSPTSRGVVATITGLEASHHMATLTTEEGEVFGLPKESQWHVGDKVECDQIYAVRPRLQHCQPWESTHAVGGTAAPSVRQPSRAEVPSTRDGEVRFLSTPTATPADECKKLRKSVESLERDRASAKTGANYFGRLEAELATARQGLARCEAQGP